MKTVEYSWDPQHSGLEAPLLSSGVVTVQPIEGKIKAGQTVLLQVTISANCGPRMLGHRPMRCLARAVPPTEVSRTRLRNSKEHSDVSTALWVTKTTMSEARFWRALSYDTDFCYLPPTWLVATCRLRGKCGATTFLS